MLSDALGGLDEKLLLLVGARHQKAVVRAGVENVTDKPPYDIGTSLFRGVPRTFNVSVGYDF